MSFAFWCLDLRMYCRCESVGMRWRPSLPQSWPATKVSLPLSLPAAPGESLRALMMPPISSQRASIELCAASSDFVLLVYTDYTHLVPGALIKDKDQDTHLQACLAVRQLSLTPKCRFQFVEMKGLQPLLALADSDSIEVQRELAAALRNLSLSEQNKISIVREGGMDVLIKFAHSLDVEIAHQSCGVLANLAEALENQGPMIDKVRKATALAQERASAAKSDHDLHKQCAAWAALGDCDTRYWMRQECAESCEHHKRTAARELRL